MSQSAAQKVQIREREAQVMALRRAGVSFRQIARQLGISESTAFGAYTPVMGRLNDLSTGDAKESKALQLARYEDLLSGVWGRATGGDLWAVDRAVAILERIDKLEGTEAPRRRIVNVVDEDTLYEMTTRIERETEELERHIAAREHAAIEARSDVKSGSRSEGAEPLRKFPLAP